jgi:glycosidase
MVTDEDRDYMWQEYARDPRMKLNLGIRRRLAPLVNNGRRQMELFYGMLLSLPGSPILYYGDEIGMGDNIYLGDRDGVRTPMQWSADRNGGFSRPGVRVPVGERRGPATQRDLDAAVAPPLRRGPAALAGIRHGEL